MAWTGGRPALLAAGVCAAALVLATALGAHAQGPPGPGGPAGVVKGPAGGVAKGPPGGGGVKQLPGATKGPGGGVVLKKPADGVVKTPLKKVDPIIVKPPIVKPPVLVRKPRVWRPGLRWRWITIPTIIIAEDLAWCHIHRYRVAGLRYHDHVECHHHIDWDHPSIRYVEAY
jgi:hypothetical protein